MNEDEIKNTVALAAEEGSAGYKRPPVKSRFPKGKSGNPFGRKKGQRNMATVLNEVLQQTVTVKQGDKSERLTKGEALIKVILTKANNGDRRANDAVSYLAEKIGRIEDKNSETRRAGGVMLVPGVATVEEFEEAMAKERKRKELQDQQRKIEAPKLRRKEAALRETIALHKGTPEGDAAASALAELTSSMEYLSNFYIKHFPEEEIVAEPPEKAEPPAKLPWDADEYVRMPFYARAKYARTHSHDVKKPELQPQLAPHPCYRRLNSKVWSSVPWSELPPDDPRLRDEPLSDGRWGK